MTGWLIYKKDEVERNRFFIEKWFQAAEALKAEISLVFAEDIHFGIKNNAAFLKHSENLALPDFAVMRLAYSLLSRHMENMGIRVFNSSKVSEICNDKRKTHMLLQGLVPMMDSAFVDSSLQSKAPFPFPLVVKASHSCGGRKVFLCKNNEEYNNALSACAPDSAVVQKLSDTIGKDVRAYVLGNKIIKTMLRFNSDGDFRSNIGQGGHHTEYILDKKTKSHIEKILALFDFDFVGIDFIFNKGELVFNEIEDAVGTRMLYAEGIDIVHAYLQYIIDKR